jgi:hypothetical protein
LRRLLPTPSFPRPSSRQPEPVEERGLGLLHAPSGVGVAEGAGVAVEGGQFQPVAQVLGRLVEREQHFKRGLRL